MASNLLPQDGQLYLYDSFLDKKEADALYVKLLKQTKWRQEDIVLFGKRVAQPRLVALQGEQKTGLTYSGLRLQADPWAQPVEKIKNKIEAFAEVEFNVVLLNLYRNERDSNGWHADDEKELGKQPTIASLSLGAERDFLIKHKTHPDLKLKIPLPHGSLLIMKGTVQENWKHSLPKRTRPLEPRINLTFRKVITINSYKSSN